MTYAQSNIRTGLLASVAFFAAAGASPALAQEQSAPPETTAAQTEEQVQQQQPTPQENTGPGTPNSEAIVVTAQKRAQVLLDVPASVTVVGGDTLERQQATSFQDFISLVPGFSVNSQGAGGVNRITLRGANTGGVASTVAVFMDDVPFGSSTGLANGAILSGDFDTFDLNRIEVLRGPQGTLYGASSFGGVLKYVPNAPKLDRFDARAQVGIEDTKDGGLGYNAAAVINVPLGTKVAFRASGFYRNDPGYIDTIGNNPLASPTQLVPPGVIPSFPNGFPFPPVPSVDLGGTLVADDINDRQSYGGRASLLFNPSDNVSVRLTAFAQDLKTDESDTFEVDRVTLKPLYGGFVQSRYQPEQTDVKYRVYSGTVDWDVGFANFFSSTAYSTFSEKFKTDYSFAFAPLVNLLAGDPASFALIGQAITATPVTRGLGVELFQKTATDKFTQEFRLSSPNNDKFEWLVGAFYTHEKSGIDPQQILATEFGTTVVAPDVFPLADLFVRSKYTEYAGFANATWHAAPRFDLTLGGRFAHNKQSAHLFESGALVGGTLENSDLNSNESVFTYSFAPRYEISDHVSIYARVASGYRPGGPNVIPFDSPDVPPTYDADRLTNWEAGIKAEAPDGRLWSTELVAYHIDWKDIQLFSRSPNGTGYNANGGKAKVDGLEFTGALRPLPGLTLSANGAYTNAKLKDDTPPLTGGFAGDPLPWVPKWSGAIHADYEFPVWSGADGFVGASVNYVGKRNAGFNEREPDGSLVGIPNYTQVDLRAGVNVDRWRIEAYAHNLFDVGGITDAFGFDGTSFPNGAAGISVIRPRAFGLVGTLNY